MIRGRLDTPLPTLIPIHGTVQALQLPLRWWYRHTTSLSLRPVEQSQICRPHLQLLTVRLITQATHLFQAGRLKVGAGLLLHDVLLLMLPCQ
jgi:hypothetical protein